MNIHSSAFNNIKNKILKINIKIHRPCSKHVVGVEHWNGGINRVDYHMGRFVIMLLRT